MAATEWDRRAAGGKLRTLTTPPVKVEPAREYPPDDLALGDLDCRRRSEAAAGDTNRSLLTGSGHRWSRERRWPVDTNCGALPFVDNVRRRCCTGVATNCCRKASSTMMGGITADGIVRCSPVAITVCGLGVPAGATIRFDKLTEHKTGFTLRTENGVCDATEA